MTRISALFAAFLAGQAWLSPALAQGQAAPPPGAVSFTADPASREVALARQVFSSFLAANPGVRVEAAFIDVNGDRTAELAARFSSPQTCTRDRCTTFVMEFDRSTGRWETIFERRSAQLRQGVMPDRSPALLVNGEEVWLRQLGDSGPFVGTLRGRGTEVWMTERPPAEVFAAARAAMPSLQPRPELSGAAAFEAGPGVRGWAVSLSDGACGNEGCPFVVLVQERGRLRAAYSGVSDAQLVVLPGRDRVMHDLGVPETAGFRIARWDGTAWRDAETSYASPVTRAP